MGRRRDAGRSDGPVVDQLMHRPIVYRIKEFSVTCSDNHGLVGQLARDRGLRTDNDSNVRIIRGLAVVVLVRRETNRAALLTPGERCQSRSLQMRRIAHLGHPERRSVVAGEQVQEALHLHSARSRMMYRGDRPTSVRIRIRYSPISPIEKSIRPLKKMMSSASDVHPSTRDGLSHRYTRMTKPRDALTRAVA